MVPRARLPSGCPRSSHWRLRRGRRLPAFAMCWRTSTIARAGRGWCPAGITATIGRVSSTPLGGQIRTSAGAPRATISGTGPRGHLQARIRGPRCSRRCGMRCRIESGLVAGADESGGVPGGAEHPPLLGQPQPPTGGQPGWRGRATNICSSNSKSPSSSGRSALVVAQREIYLARLQHRQHAIGIHHRD